MSSPFIDAITRAERSLHAYLAGDATLDVVRDSLYGLSGQLSRSQMIFGTDDAAGICWTGRVHEIRRSIHAAADQKKRTRQAVRRAVLSGISELAPLFAQARLEEMCAL